MVKPEKAAPVTRTILRTRGPVSADSLRRDGTAQPVSQDQIQRRERGQGKVHFPCSADHNEQDWQPHPVDPYSAISDGNHTRLIHTLAYTFIHIFYSHDAPRYYRPPPPGRNSSSWIAWTTKGRRTTSTTAKRWDSWPPKQRHRLRHPPLGEATVGVTPAAAVVTVVIAMATVVRREVREPGHARSLFCPPLI